jgi:hypothetical protein
LLACLIAGALVGRFFPDLGAMAAVLGQLYLGVVGMAALPLLVVATFFGLRQTLALPQPGQRVLMIAALAVLLVGVCALVGTAAGSLLQPGRNIDRDTREYLGAMVQQAGAAAGDSEMLLDTSNEPPAEKVVEGSWAADVVPDNFFRVLAEGRSLGILLCTIPFGLAFAALGRGQNGALTGVFETIYRALETIISRVNLFIPVLVFSMAAYFAARTDARTLAAMSGFIGWFMCLALLLSAMGGGRHPSAMPAAHGPGPVRAQDAGPHQPHLRQHHGQHPRHHRGHEHPPRIQPRHRRTGHAHVVGLPARRLGAVLRAPRRLRGQPLWARARAGGAGAHLRQRVPGRVCIGGQQQRSQRRLCGLVLGMLQLPAEAALALFLAIDLICEGPRNLLTLLFACLLTSLVSRGLPSERVAASEGCGRRGAQACTLRLHPCRLGAGCRLRRGGGGSGGDAGRGCRHEGRRRSGAASDPRPGQCGLFEMSLMRRTFLLKSAALVLAAGSVAGCSTITGAVKGAVNKAMNLVTFKGTRLAWSEVVIAAGDGANLNSPVAVDIVLVMDEAALEKLAALPAGKWFQMRADMLRTFPGTFSYKSWEVAPGQNLRLRGDSFGTRVL